MLKKAIQEWKEPLFFSIKKINKSSFKILLNKAELPSCLICRWFGDLDFVMRFTLSIWCKHDASTLIIVKIIGPKQQV